MDMPNWAFMIIRNANNNNINSHCHYVDINNDVEDYEILTLTTPNIKKKYFLNAFLIFLL